RHYPPLFHCSIVLSLLFLFFLHHPPTPDSSPLSLHDALPISLQRRLGRRHPPAVSGDHALARHVGERQERSARPHQRRQARDQRSEEHTSELQSLRHLVCRLLLEKKKKKTKTRSHA